MLEENVLATTNDQSEAQVEQPRACDWHCEWGSLSAEPVSGKKRLFILLQPGGWKLMTGIPLYCFSVSTILVSHLGNVTDFKLFPCFTN